MGGILEHGLTRREKEVALLVRDGLTDRDIAERLFITRRTAEWHLKQIFNKLGFNSRAQVAAWVAHLQAIGGKPGSPDARRHNLPLQLTTFVGRSRDLDGLERLLTVNRLVTLTGVAGGGKTRLAIEVATRALAAYSDGAWLVELAPFREGRLVPRAIASVLRVQERPRQPIEESLVDHLRNTRMLFVLDNCEHVIEDCARLVDSILSSCVGITVLATSREPLRVSGEVVWRLNPLQVPNPEGPIDMNELAQCEAVQLFVNRAKLVAPDFELSSDNGMQVAGLCSSLDGLPLAIELAAARVGLMAPDQILNRLKDRFGLLTSGSRSGPARHRTLQAAIDWSHELLSTDERVLFRRSSVFADSFNLETAERVCNGDDLQPASVADLLASLVDKSLVIATGHAQRPVRFRMLETLHQYASARLRETGEEKMCKGRHAEHFIELVETENPAETVRRSASWRILIADDYSNIIAAMAWAAAADTESLLRLVAPMGAYWVSSGYTGEGIQWISTALARPSRNSRARLMCQMYAAWLSWLGGDMPAAHSWAEGLEAAQGVVDDRRLESRAMHVRGLVASFGDGDYAAGAELFNQALAMAREAGDRQGMAETLDTLGATTIFMGDLTTARRYLEEGLALSLSLGYDNGISLAQCFLGGVDFLEGSLQVAEQRLLDAIRLGLASHYRWVVATSLDILSWVIIRQGDERRGLLLAGATESAYRWAQVDPSITFRRLYEANVLPAIDRLGPNAAPLLEEGRLMAVDAALDFALGRI